MCETQMNGQQKQVRRLEVRTLNKLSQCFRWEGLVFCSKLFPCVCFILYFYTDMVESCQSWTLKCQKEERLCQSLSESVGARKLGSHRHFCSYTSSSPRLLAPEAGFELII